MYAKHQRMGIQTLDLNAQVAVVQAAGVDAFMLRVQLLMQLKLRRVNDGAAK